MLRILYHPDGFMNVKKKEEERGENIALAPDTQPYKRTRSSPHQLHKDHLVTNTW